MALHVKENIDEDLFVIINKLFSTKYPIDIFDLTKELKGMIYSFPFKDLVSLANYT